MGQSAISNHLYRPEASLTGGEATPADTDEGGHPALQACTTYRRFSAILLGPNVNPRRVQSMLLVQWELQRVTHR
jgi:hypothetical protein